MGNHEHELLGDIKEARLALDRAKRAELEAKLVLAERKTERIKAAERCEKLLSVLTEEESQTPLFDRPETADERQRGPTEPRSSMSPNPSSVPDPETAKPLREAAGGSGPAAETAEKATSRSADGGQTWRSMGLEALSPWKLNAKQIADMRAGGLATLGDLDDALSCRPKGEYSVPIGALSKASAALAKFRAAGGKEPAEPKRPRKRDATDRAIAEANRQSAEMKAIVERDPDKREVSLRSIVSRAIFGVDNRVWEEFFDLGWIGDADLLDALREIWPANPARHVTPDGEYVIRGGDHPALWFPASKNWSSILIPTLADRELCEAVRQVLNLAEAEPEYIGPKGASK